MQNLFVAIVPSCLRMVTIRQPYFRLQPQSHIQDAKSVSDSATKMNDNARFISNRKRVRTLFVTHAVVVFIVKEEALIAIDSINSLRFKYRVFLGNQYRIRLVPDEVGRHRISQYFVGVVVSVGRGAKLLSDELIVGVHAVHDDLAAFFGLAVAAAITRVNQ